MEVERTRPKRKKKAKSKNTGVSAESEQGEGSNQHLKSGSPEPPQTTEELHNDVSPENTTELCARGEPTSVEQTEPEAKEELLTNVGAESTGELLGDCVASDEPETKFTTRSEIPHTEPKVLAEEKPVSSTLESAKELSPPIEKEKEQIVDYSHPVLVQQDREAELIADNEETVVVEDTRRICTVTEATPVVMTTVEPTAPILAPVETAVLYPNLQKECCAEESLVPWSEAELCRLYQNAQLNALEKFVDNFVKQAKRENHEFYELLVSYLKARLALTVAQKQLEGCQSEYEEFKKNVWSIENHTITSHGKCQDRNNVSSSYSYNVANLNVDNIHSLSVKLAAIRKLLKEELSMRSYTCQVARLHIEHYVYSLICSMDRVPELPSNAPVACHIHTHDPSHLSLETAKLKDCISVLFIFQRRPSQDEQFLKDCLQWLETLLSCLLRLATLLDHQFILHHLLRCPPGVSEWAAKYVQIPSPNAPVPTVPNRQTNWDPFAFEVGLGLHTDWGGPLLDHFVTQLASIILPVREREDFLAGLGVKETINRTRSRENPSDSGNWQFVTESLDCEQEDDQMLLRETDLIAFYDQFSFGDMFRHILNVSDNDAYSVENITPGNMLRLLAFCTCLVRLLGSSFTTFRKTRYREFVKRIGRSIRHSVHYVSDHWLGYKSHFESSSEKMATVAHMVPRLQVEYDEFVVRSARWLLSAHKLGAWQFLADLPYSLLSMKVLLRIFYMLYSCQEEEDPSRVPRTVRDLDSLLRESHLHEQFIDQLMTTLTSETVFLLTTFSNMARCRQWDGAEDRMFIQLIAGHLFEITQVSDFARDVYSKTGASLLETIATVHPQIISDLMDRAKVTVGSAQETHIDLFRELPIHLWRPSEDDTSTLRDWLISYPIDSAENQISRSILINLNWGAFDPRVPNELALGPKYHRDTAVLLVEALATHLANQPGGHEFDISLAESSGKKGFIQSLAFWSGTLTKEQGTFQTWCWKVVLMLKLHPCQLDFEQYCNRADWMEVTFKGLQWGELSKEMDLVDVQRSVRSGGLVAYYVALCTSLSGVSFEQFQSDGLPLLQRLVESGYYIPCLRAFSNIFPQLISNRRVLVHDERFLNVVHLMAAADSMSAGMFTFSKPETVVLKSMVAMMQSQFTLYRDRGMIDFWLDVLTAQTNWFREPCILHLLNALSRNVIQNHQLHKHLQSRYLEIYKEKEPFQSKKGGFLSTLSNLAGKSTPPFSFTAQYENNDFPWLTFDLLWVETECEHDLWLELIRVLHHHKKMYLDNAIRKGCEGLGYQSNSYPAYHLALFRWAQLCLNLPMESPLLPLVWQKFFSLYLHRVAIERSLPLRESYGHRILSYQNGMSKKLKIQLQTLVKFYKEQLHDLTQNPPLDEQEEKMKTHYQKIIDLYSKLKCWAEEPLLHEGDIVLSALPANFDVPRLQEMFEPQIAHLWLDYLPTFLLEEEDAKLLKEWKKVEAIQKTLSSVPEKSPASSESAATRILSRLSKTSACLPPPPLIAVQNPLQAVPLTCYLSASELEQHLKEDLRFVQSQARTFYYKNKNFDSADTEYIHLLPQLHKNVSKQFHVSQPCQKKSKDHFCNGPATIIFKFDEMVTDLGVEAQLGQNRSFYNETLRELLVPVPYQLCCTVVSVEQIVAEMSRIIESGPPEHQTKALDAAVGLFYCITQFITVDTRQYPPTCQFFSSALAILGQQFLPRMPNQSLQVLQLIHDSPHLSDLLVPLYDPNLSLEHFVGQYQEVVDRGNKPTKLPFIFSLITKFSITDWLSRATPDHQSCRDLLKAAFRGLSFCGPEPTEDEVAMLFEVYRKHFCIVLRSDIPALLPFAIDHLLEGIDSNTMSPVLWLDMIELMRVGTGKEPLPQTELSLQEIQKLIHTLSSHFSTKQLSLDTLYSGYRPHTKNISEFLKFIVLSLLRRWTELIEQDSSHTENGIADCWGASLALFGPWILPPATPTSTPTDDQTKLYPWLHDQVDQAHQVMSAFVGVLSSLHLGLPSDRVIALIWQFYLQYVAVDNQSLFVLEVYHSEFTQLPWHHFIPEVLDLENMISLQSRTVQPLFFSFCCFISTKLDWMKVNSLYRESQAEGSSGDLLCVFHCLVLKLMVMVSQDSNMLVEGSSLPDVLDRVSKLEWNFLDSKSMKDCCDWLNSNCSSKDILMKGSPLSLVLSLLKEAAEFPSSDDKLRNPEHPQKRCAYVRLLMQILSECTHQRTVSRQDIFSPISDIFATISSFALYEHGSQNSIIQLVEDVLNLLNTANPGNGTLDKIIVTFQDILTKCPNMHMITMETIRAAVRTIVAVEHMVEVVETCIDVRFASIPDMVDPDKEWKSICSTMAIPEGIIEQFRSECIRKNLFLSLFGLSLSELSALEHPRLEVDLMVKMTQWSSRMKPESTQESRALLLWWKTLQLMLRQIRYVGKVVAVVPHLTEMAQSLCRFGEDKASEGLLGVIGLGKKSIYSIQLRLLARGVGCFLHSQLPHDKEHKTLLRMTPNAPGALGEGATGGCQPTKVAEQNFKSLQSLTTNKTYQPLKDQISFVLEFINNPEHNVMSSLDLFVYLTQALFPSESKFFLSVLSNKI